ncbi:MAG: putative amidase [Ilumatobacteraceae bacterium]|nr:putative amidase [Ilumatobacteraceae bacterium]MCU1387657.1 putative amidase [Ilumatobacteraceae bacterium]
MANEIWRDSAHGMAAKIRSGEVSSREVVDAHLARIEEVNPHLNAVVRVLADEARAAADAADQARANGDHLPPLHGVPFTVKENIDVAGTPTTSGILALADAVAPIDAPGVGRLRAAGAIPIGRTNLPDFGLRVHTDSSLHGLTRNPWNPNVTAAGSSGGEASAISSGMSPFGLGNDIGGSLRNPAHCCGIASIKPSVGVVPAASVIPPLQSPIAFQLMAVEGVMARHVADVRFGLETIASVDPRDPVSLPVRLSDVPVDRPLRIAVIADPPGGTPTDPGIMAAVQHCADLLSDLGHVVKEAAPAEYERSLTVWAMLLGGDLRTQRPILDMVLGEGSRRFIELTDELIPEMDLAGWSTIHAERNGIAKAWAEFFTDYDAIISPVWTQPAFAHGADIVDVAGARATLDLIRPTLPANLLGLPAAVVPAGIFNGMPVGVQIIGDRFHDLACLSIAAMIEQSVGVLTPIDPVLV